MTDYKMLICDLDLILELDHIKNHASLFNTLKRFRVPLVNAEVMQAEQKDAAFNAEETDRLTREIDIVINGENAAEQASLVDILAQLNSFPVADTRVRKPHPIRLLLPYLDNMNLNCSGKLSDGVRLTGLPIRQAGKPLKLLNLEAVFTREQADVLTDTFELNKANFPEEDAHDKPGVGLEKGLPAVDDIPEDVILYDSLAKSNDPLVLLGVHNYHIPDGYKWITVDRCGAVKAHMSNLSPECAISDWRSLGSDMFHVTNIDPNKIGDWTKCITELKSDDIEIKVDPETFIVSENNEPLELKGHLETSLTYDVQWNEINAAFMFVATNEKGDIWAYSEEPEYSPGVGKWFIKNEKNSNVITKRLYKAPNDVYINDWKNSLQERPE